MWLLGLQKVGLGYSTLYHIGHENKLEITHENAEGNV